MSEAALWHGELQKISDFVVLAVERLSLATWPYHSGEAALDMAKALATGVDRVFAFTLLRGARRVPFSHTWL